MPKIIKIRSKLLYVVRGCLMLMGALFLLQLILAMTLIPDRIQRFLSRSLADVPENTNTIVIMGAGGYPSEDLLMRLWYSAQLAHDFPEAKLIVTTPGSFSDSTSTIYQMYSYFIKEGISEGRLLIDSLGLNTRHQALMVKKIVADEGLKGPMVVVTSPEHVYRSVKCFRKVGLANVSGLPTIDVELETDLRIEGKRLGGKTYFPDSGKSISLRYKFWEYLKVEINVSRELIALFYYKIQGWI